MGRAGVLIGPQIETLAVQNERLFHFREQDKAAHGRVNGRVEERVIAARVQADYGGRGESP